MFNGWIGCKEFKFWSWVVQESAVWGNSKATMLWNLWIWKEILHWFRGVRTCLNGFSKILTWLNLGLDLTFSSSWSLNFEPDIGQVQKSSGSNQGSELDCGSTNPNTGVLGHHDGPMSLRENKLISTIFPKYIIHNYVSSFRNAQNNQVESKPGFFSFDCAPPTCCISNQDHWAWWHLTFESYETCNASKIVEVVFVKWECLVDTVEHRHFCE